MINEFTKIIGLINKIIEYSKKNNTLLIYFTNQFWTYILSQYKIIIDKENIDNCYKLRKIFKKYHQLINYLNNLENLGKDLKDEYKMIENNVNRYYIRDEFGFILNKNVKEYLVKNKEQPNSKKLGMIEQYNPYFNIEDDDDRKKYVNYKDTSIFDYINFDEEKKQENFIKNFKKLNFEEVFENNIREYYIKIVSKIKNISTFGIVIKLIDTKKIKDKIKDYYGLLEDKFDNIINKIELINDEKELSKAITIICEFNNMIYLFEKEENKKEFKNEQEIEHKKGNNCRFLIEKIDKLDNKIKSLIYNELIKINKGNEFQDMKEFIFKYFIQELDDASDLIKVIDNLADDSDRKKSDKKKFLKDLIDKCKFTKEEFFSNHENKKIKLLSDLNEKLNARAYETEEGEKNKMFKIEREDLGEKLEKILDEIRQDIDGKSFCKVKLEEFLESKKNDKKPDIVKKLGLIKIVIVDYNGGEVYDKLTDRINIMNQTIDRLNKIKKSLSIFHKVKFKTQINEITKIIENIETKPINQYNNQKMKDSISDVLGYEKLAEKIDIVKNLMIFKIIFANTKGDEEGRFNKGKNELDEIKKSFQTHQKNLNEFEKNGNNKDKRDEGLDDIMVKNEIIFDKMKDELCKYDESKSYLFINQMIDYFEIKNESLKKDIKIFFKSKKYEIDIKSIKYFFDTFLSTKLTIPSNIDLSKMKLKEIKRILEKLKNDGIYDYESDSYYYNIFTSLYKKDEALDFLLEKIKNNSNIEYLKGLLDPTQRRLSIKNIEDTIECLKNLSEIINKDEKEILKHIKSLDKDKIDKFISYSKIYEAIKELDESNPEKDDDNIVNNVDTIIKKAYFEFREDIEDFSYYKAKKYEKIDLNYLINLNSQINIRPLNIKKDDGKPNKKDIFEQKCEKLLFYKSLVADLEEIYEKMQILRAKGCNIPRIIRIEIEYPNIEYYLNDQFFENIDDIKKFLFNIRSDFESKLNQVYKEEKYSRFLYGKIFRKIKLHISNSLDIFEIIRYILNITDNNKKINDGDMDNTEPVEDYYNYYSMYNSGTFKRITEYIRTLFIRNNLNLEEHYNKMLIKEKDKYKGFYFNYCKKISMEEYILCLFYEKLGQGQLPISQNILICSKETSIEEIQSFLYRSILCEYNTLFVFEIIESLTDFQYNKIYTYIDRILSIKLEKYNSKNNENVDKFNTKLYLNSLIVFVYNKKEVKNYLKELEKYSGKKLDNGDFIKYEESGFFSNNNSLENINFKELEKIVNSDECNEKDIDDSINDSILNMSANINFEFKNLKIISSDVCGLGKSYQIRKMINLKNLEYYHLPLGGKLTKNIIYTKISNLFKKIKNDKKIQTKTPQIDIIEYKDIAIHIDLSESKEISLINEFIFSFLITKFYINNEDIIFIPKDLNIYIEIPNCLGENYLKKVGILNHFQIENIVLGDNVKPHKKKNIKNIKMGKLELSEKIRNLFKKMLKFSNKNEDEENKEIEEYIKKILGIKEYSFHQIQIFIKLFISQFSKLDGEIYFKDYYDRDITEKRINNFAETTKYFTNGGFAQLLIKKDIYEEDKFKLYSEAYRNDLENAEFKTLYYVDSKTKKCNLIDLGDTAQGIKKNKKKDTKKEDDIIYLLDATGSMRPEINAANEQVIQIFNDLKEKFKNEDKDFNFGAVFYRDEIYAKEKYKNDEYYINRNANGLFQLTNNMKNLQDYISTIKTQGGFGYGGDWVAGYKLALNNIKWREGTKLIIHIADDGAHGDEFTKNDPLPQEGRKLTNLIKNCVDDNINIVAFKIGNDPRQSFEKTKEVYDEYKLSKRKNRQFMEIYEFNREKVSDEFKKLVFEAINEVANPTFFYLKRLKHLLNLPNEVDNDVGDKKSLLSILDIPTQNESNSHKKDKYVITDDNYKKMILLIYRIQADVPVIIMGETGCGKTHLIEKLNQILNNGKNLVGKIKIHPGITDEEICKEMRKMNEEAKKQQQKGNEQWIFFDEINTCSSLTLLTEIFINRTFNGEKLEDNIRLIGACNPYRKKLNTTEKCGLTVEDDEEENDDDHLVYKVNELPLSLLYYTYSFGSITIEDEKKYIESIINQSFHISEKKLFSLTTQAISKCHQFLRETFGEDNNGKIIPEPSVVSLREMNRFTRCIDFFQDYYLKKDSVLNKYDINKISDEQKKVNKIKSIICSIYLCYYIRIMNRTKRGKFNRDLEEILFQLINEDENQNKPTHTDFIDKIKFKPLYEDIKYKKNKDGKNKDEKKEIKGFSDFLKIEQNFLLKQIDLEDGIGENNLLKENLFLLFVSVVTKIPLIIVGKPGTGKSLSSKLIYNAMRGEYSKKDFFKQYPKIIQIYFQGSKSNTPEDVEKLFRKSEKLIKQRKNLKKNEKMPIYMILFDELGLADKSPTNPLKKLHHKLEYDETNEDTCFIGLSNYTLDAAKTNRALFLSIPNLEELLDELINTSKGIVKNISSDLIDQKNMIVFNILSETYYYYKSFVIYMKKLRALKSFFEENKNYNGEKKTFEEIQLLPEFKNILKEEKEIKTEFHGNRDFYSIIKSVAIEGSNLENINDETQIKPIIEKYIERNFGGINYEIDLSFKFNLEDKEKILKEVKSFLGEEFDKEYKLIFTSVELFKNIFNLICEKNENQNYKIDLKNINKYDLNKCINDNINDYNSRYLLLEIEQNLTPLIIENIKNQNQDKKDKIKFMNGSTFPEDDNKEYRFKKINEIQDLAAETDRILIEQNLNQVQPYLYDLYNMNYKIIDGQKFVRICLENLSEQDTPVNNSFRIIILVNKEFVNSIDMAFLNRFEKMQIIFDDLLNDDQIVLIRNIRKEIGLNGIYNKKFNYYLKNLLINCSAEEIAGLVYSFSIEKNDKINEVKQLDKEKIEKIKDKIYTKISNILPQDIIANLKDDNNVIKLKYYKEKRFCNFDEYKKGLNYKISIIYTFTKIGRDIQEKEFLISGIRTENQLKTKIDEYINNDKNYEEQNNKIIIIDFEQYNSNKIQFVSDIIMNYYKNDGYKYIFLVHIRRRFIKDKENYNRIYTIPNINEDINQIFIDNLNGPSNITLKDLLTKKMKDLMTSNNKIIDEEVEFNNSLSDFVHKQINEKNKIDIFKNPIKEDYLLKLKTFMEKNEYIKKELINKAKELIDENKISKGGISGSIDTILKTKPINKNTIDLVSHLLDYIREKIFNENLIKVLEYLEHENLLTTLIELDNDKDAYNKLGEDLIKDIINKFLSELKIDDKIEPEPKFLWNYYIPGFYYFYCNLSDYINKSISGEFMNIEIQTREMRADPKLSSDKIKLIYHDKEAILLNLVEDYINQDKKYSDILKRISSTSLIKEDYITFYLDKYIDRDIDFQNDFKNNNKIIKLLSCLRYSEDKYNIAKNDEEINIILKKIIWIESNKDYIKSILEIFDHAKIIVPNDNVLYQTIEDKIYDRNINIEYIVDENREHIREVNECFYLLLAGICLGLVSDEIKLGIEMIHNYNTQLKKINIILKDLDYDLILDLNEVYIIDELIQIIEYQYQKGININTIIKIRNNLRDSVIYIKSGKILELLKIFENIYNILKNEPKDKKYYNKYYETLKYIFMKEIEKVNDIRYHEIIVKSLIAEKDVIKKSNDIFQKLLESYISTEEGEIDLINFKSKILEENSGEIINYLNENLKNENNENYTTLKEILIYFFEKNSLIYLKNKSLENKKPKNFFIDCNKYLNEDIGKYKNSPIINLLCVAYIKVYCYLFIKRYDVSPKTIIETINKDVKLNIIKIYIYKIIYNLNDRQIDIFLNKEGNHKYNLQSYDYKLSEFKEEEKSNFIIKTLDDDNYQKVYDTLVKLKNDGKFNDKIEFDELCDDDNKLKFDNFYIAAFNLILSNLKKKGFDTSDIYENFFKNICEPLFGKSDDKDNKLFSLIQFLFNPEIYKKIKKEYGINPINIESLLYGYRYCLNEIAEKYVGGEYIFSILYNKDKTDYLKKKFYPGSDTRSESYYELYNKIENHFKKNPNEGCYICLCDKGYYHKIPSGFPGYEEKGLKCPYCNRFIGTKEIYIKDKENKLNLFYEPIKSENYFRIFFDEKEVNDTDKIYLSKINYMTKDAFKNKYIIPLYKKEEGLNEIDENKFRKNNKIIRNLDQISYRLLNYILYSHLFFAKLLTNEDIFDDYLPKLSDNKRMSWINMINECFILLKKELDKKGINRIDIFMNLIFKDLFTELHKQKCIDKYKDLIDFENNKLRPIILNKINEAIDEIKKIEETEKKNCENKSAAIALLKELYNKEDYKDEFPYYEYFYYSNYLDENYITDILEYMEKTEYPIVRKYLEFNKLKRDKKNNDDKYLLKDLTTFNKVINLFNKNYSLQITKEFAEKTYLKDDEIYLDNKDLFEKFIKIFNSYDFKDEETKKIIKLNNENYLCDFVLDDDNKYGKAYKKIYNIFGKKQNDKLKEILKIKYQEGIFNSNSMKKINIQKIKENEIFTDDLWENINFIELIFNSSYRKIIDTGKYQDYNEFELNLDLLESEMTNKILKNKKLVNEELIYFKYKNEIFKNSVNDLIITFESKYKIADINNEDKAIIYEYIKEYPYDHEKYQIIIDNFIIFIKHLIKIKEEENNKINEKTKIFEIIDNVGGIDEDFKKIFKDKNDLTVNKISNIYDYYLQLIFKYVKEDIIQYQEKMPNEDNKDSKDGQQQNQTYFSEKIIQKLGGILNKKDDIVITKNLLATALRLFITIVLYREKDKENKIKQNNKNIVEYLNKKDLWKNINIKDDTFNKNLIEIKSLNIKIKEILWLYLYLMDNKDDDFEKDIRVYLDNKKVIDDPVEAVEGSDEERKNNNKKSNNIRKTKNKGPSIFDDYYDNFENDDEDSEPDLSYNITKKKVIKKHK